jgi:putative ABC transport system ATP-binding protein
LSSEPVMVDSLVKAYKLGRIEVQALRGLNLKVESGKMASIIGPSGSGKTTLLNILGGLDRATAGTVTVGDLILTELGPTQLVAYRREMVGHIFQTLNLIPTLTAEENVELPMMAAGTPRSKRASRTKELLNVVGLLDRNNHKPDELSGGEQQRVAIAAALANDPPVLLADEPTGELDSVNARMVTEYLVRINRELGKTVIMVTHDQNVARVADNIMRIEDGTIKASLTPSQIAGPEASTSYLDQLRRRAVELENQMRQLDEDFKSGRIGADDFAEHRVRLRQIRAGVQDELQRQGVIG